MRTGPSNDKFHHSVKNKKLNKIERVQNPTIQPREAHSVTTKRPLTLTLHG